MYIQYRAQTGPIQYDGDLIEEALGSPDGDIDKDLRTMGYTPAFNLGHPEVASIEMFTRWKGEIEFAAIAMIALGENIDIYAFPTMEDAWACLQTLAPTVKVLSELAQMKFD